MKRQRRQRLERALAEYSMYGVREMDSADLLEIVRAARNWLKHLETKPPATPADNAEERSDG